MAKKFVKGDRAFAGLELILIGMLFAVILSIGFTAHTGNTVKASNSSVKGPDGRKVQDQQKRRVPREGFSEAPIVDVSAALGTPNACLGFDFSDGTNQGFMTEAVSGATLWHIANNTCRADLAGHSTPFTFYYGQDATCNYNTGARNSSNLISPPISLMGLFPPYTIGFNYLLFVESSTSFDTTFVDLSTDNGATWTPVLSKTNLINDNQWHNIGADVTALVGAATSVRLRFRFDSVDNLVNSSTGWHVDDVLVCGNPFDVCIQDNNNGNTFQFNSITGLYLFTKCGPDGFTLTGTGVLGVKNGVLNLTHYTPDRRVQAFLYSNNRGTAGIQSPPNAFPISIIDSNITDNSCTCP